MNGCSIAEENEFSVDTDFLPKKQSLLLPIDCKCNGGLFQAEIMKTIVKGDNFYGTVESLEGLTTCKSIKEKNSGVLNLTDKDKLLLPLRCACLSSPETKLLLSYSVS